MLAGRWQALYGPLASALESMGGSGAAAGWRAICSTTSLQRMLREPLPQTRASEGEHEHRVSPRLGWPGWPPGGLPVATHVTCCMASRTAFISYRYAAPAGAERRDLVDKVRRD
jgi:hypothetical protein